MKPASTRRVVEPVAPPMTDAEFELQIERHSGCLGRLHTPEQQRKAAHYPDLARAAAALTVAFDHALNTRGSHDAEQYHRALVGIRRAVGTWSNVDARFGAVLGERIQ